MTGGLGRGPGPLDANAVIVIDLRASATGADATDPAAIGEDTLEERQRALAATILSGAAAGQWRLIDIDRVLVVDDADVFADHAGAYEHLTHAPMFGRMLCLVIGNPKAAPSLDIPRAVDASRSPVLWVGDPRGVGWQMGRSRTTRLAFNDADPDGTLTLTRLIEALSRHEVYDHVTAALGGLPYRLGAPALLPWERWPGPLSRPAPRPAAVAPARDPEVARSTESPPAVSVPAAPLVAVLHRAVRWYVLYRAVRRYALGGALLVGAVALAVALGARGPGYLAAAAACAVAGILVILARFRRRPAPASSPPVAGEPAPSPAVASAFPPGQGPSDPDEPEAPPEPAVIPLDDGILARAAWLLSASSDDELFRQLSSPDQLLMLSGEPHLARLVRFAPEGARSHVGRLVSTDHVVAWTASGDTIGTIRFVSLKAGLLRLE